jgi:creatinine amidohydrolase
MWWHEQSWPRIESLPKDTPVVVPIGSIEQHGRHLPLCVDTAQVTAIAERAQTELGDAALFLPTLWLGCSEHHNDFPGTVSVKPSLYTEMIKSVARSILRAGFTRVLFFNGHGGNETPAAQALTELVGEDDVADAAYLVFSSWWQVGRESLSPPQHGLTTHAITHACEYEASMMLALRPDLVDLAAAREQPPVLNTPWFRSEHGGRVRLFRRFHRLTGSGSMGKPTAATAAKGQSMLTAVTADVVAFLRDFATWPELPPLRETPSPRT